MAVVKMPNGDLVNFPDDMSREAIGDLIEKKFPGTRRESKALSGADPYDNALEVAGKAAQNLGPSLAGTGHSLATMGAEAVTDLLTEPKLNPGVEPAMGSDGKPLPVVPSDAGLGVGARTVTNALGATDAIKAGAAGVAADQKLRRADRDAQVEANAPDVREGSIEGYLYDVTFAGLDMAGPMAMSLLLKNPAPMMTYGAARSGGEGYQKARDAGLDPSKARLAAGLYAASEAIGEGIPTQMLIKGGKTLVGSIVRGIATEAISEAATEAMGVLIDAGVIGEDMTLEDALKRIGYAGMVAAPLGGGFGAAGHMTRRKEPGDADAAQAIVPQTEPKDDNAPAPEQILALPKPGTILALPKPDEPTELARRHPQLPPGTDRQDTLPRDTEALRDQQARLALERTKQAETAELLALARETITPIGAFTESELGPELTGKIRAQRVRTGRPIDGPITMLDLVNAKVPQGEIDALLAWKRPRSSAGLVSPSDVRAVAREKNLNLDSAFSELALRTTGARNLDRMSQAQLGALVSTLEGMTAQPAPTSIPIADLPNFSESQYDAAVAEVRAKGRYTFDAVKTAAGTKNSKVAAEIRDAMVRRGQLVHRGGSDYRLYDVSGAERQATPDDLPRGAFSEYTVKQMPVRQVRIKQDGRSLGTFDSASAARDKIRQLREAEGKTGAKPSQLEITHDADAQAFAVMENRYDEEGRLLGQVPVNTTRSRTDAEGMAEKLRKPPEALPAEATTPVTTKLGYRSSVVREGLQDQQQSAEAAAAQPKPKRQPIAAPGLRGREAEVLQRVRDHVVSRALPLLGVKTRLTNAIATPEGVYATGMYVDNIITMSTLHFRPDMTIDEITNELAETIDHELVHALRRAGILQSDNDTWETLTRYVTKAKRPAGQDGAGLTYLAYAQANYADLPGYDTPDAMVEEAIAEAFRMWAANRRNVAGKPAGIFRQLVQWFRELVDAMPNSVFNAIASGEMVRAALTPPGSSQPRAVAVRQMQEAGAAAQTVTGVEEIRARSREYVRARQQARDDRAGRSGPKTVIGTTPSRAYDSGAFGPRDWIADKVTELNTKRGQSTTRLPTYLPEPMAFLRQVADAQQAATHSPLRTDVVRAYNALKGETKLMFENLGLTVVEWSGDGQPYATPEEMYADMAGGRIQMRLTDELFGEGPNNDKHPMLQPSGFTTDTGKALSFNDIFRVVHDAYGHGQSGFRGNAQGDYNAYHEHARLVSPEARPALATETLAQSAWHHYGPHLRRTDGTIPQDGDLDYLPSDQKEWAEQKAFLLPASMLESDPGNALASAELEEAPRYAVANDKLKQLIEQNAGLKGVLKHLTPDEAAKVKARNAAELVEIFSQLPDPSEMAAVAYAARAKRGWYEKSAEALVRIFGVNDAPRFAALLAATSPQTSVEMNSVNALQMWTGWIRAGRPTEREAILQVMAENVVGGRGIDSVLPAWINNSLTALQADDPGAIVLSGPKVNSFMLNLRGAVEEVTNDAWMANYALVDQTLFRKTGPAPGKGVGYIAMNAAVRKAAAAATRLTGERWTPEQIQETVWSWAKTLYEKANTTTSAEELLAAGRLTHEEISTTPDFASLFTGGVYRNILEKGGYADALTTIDRSNQPDGGDALRGDVTSAEGSGFAQSTFDRHLRRAARRLDALRTRRSELASREEAGGIDGLRPRGLRSGLPDGRVEWVFDDGRNVTETRDRIDFLEKLRAAKASHGPVGAQVAEEPGARMFLFDDGQSGFSLDGDNIVAVFSTAGGKSNVAGRVIDLAVQEGGRRLDGFNTFLPKLYAKHGFRAVARMPFNPEFAPEGWNYEAMAAFSDGRPDVVFMAYDPYNSTPDTDVVVQNYTEGTAAQNRVLNAGDPVKYMVGPGAPLFGKPRSPGGALSAPAVEAAPFTEERDGNKWFAGGNAETQLSQARAGTDGALLTYMSTEEFLKLTHGADPEQEIYDAAVAEGLRFNTIPSLVVDGHAGTIRVVGHDGRYAAQSLDGRVTQLPVMLYPRNKKELGLVTALEPTKEARDARPIDDAEGGSRGGSPRSQEIGGTLRPLQRLPGLPSRSPGPNARVVAAAEAYLKSIGLPHRRQAYHVIADPERGARIAAAYDAMAHAPGDIRVQAAYQAMIKEVKAQYQAALDAGLQVEIIRGEDPYPEGPKQVLADLMDNNHLWVYPTESGFGTINSIADNPLLEPTDFMVGSHQMLANDLFRVVHDYFGHGLEGAGFGASGEENAWQAHMRMFTPTAALAMTSETRGQNSWVNFGPYGEQNRAAQRETVYADQKVGILPDWVLAEGVVDDEPDVAWVPAAAPGNTVPMKPRAENYPADREQGQPKYSINAAFGQRVPASGVPTARNIVRSRTDNIIGKFINSVGRSKVNIAGSSIFDMRVKLQDRYLSVKEMIENIEDAGGTVNDANHTYMREQLFHGRVQDQLNRREKNVYQPLFDGIREAVAKDGITVDEFENYLYAKHAPERNALLRARGSKIENPSGMSDAEAVAIIDKAAAAGHRVTLERLARLAYAITADTTRTRNESGLLSDDAANSSPFRYYVPLKGFAEEDLDPELNGDPEGLRARTGRGFTIGGKEDRSMTGRERKAGDLLGHLLLQNTEAVIRGEKNLVAMSLARLLKENPNTGYGTILESKPTRRVVGPNGMIREAGDPNYKNDPTIVTAKYKGGEIVMRVEPRVARAMRGDGVAAMGKFVTGLAWMNRYLATVNTSLNPEFLISNLARDLQASNILAQQYDIKGLSRKITSAVPGAIKGILAVQRKGDAATGKWAQAFREMQAAGGTVEFMGIHDLDNTVKKIRKGVTAGGHEPLPRQALNQVQNVFKLMNDVNTSVENALRLGAFVAAREAGVSADQAAFLAKNLTVNFNKGGENKTAANAMYLFYNAAIQGSTVLINGLKHKKVQKLAGAVIAAGFVLDMVNRMLLGGDDDEDGNGVGDYDEIPEHVLERNMVIMLPGSRNYVAIPMPYGFNAFFNTGRNLSNMFSGSPVHSPGKSAISILMGGLNAFNPLGGTNSIVSFLAPTFLDPVADLLSNTDFTGRDIVPERMDMNGVPVPESQKFWNTTNPIYKWTADQLNSLTGGDAVSKGAVDLSPEVLEYWTDYTLGAAGKFLIRSGTTTAQTLSGNFQDVEMDDVPFARKVVGSVTNRGNTELYYNHAQDIMTLKARLDMYAEDGNGPALRRTIEGNRSRLPLIGLYEDIGKELTAMRKAIREAREAPIPEDKRRVIIENMQARMDQLMAVANAQYHAMVK